MKSLAIRPFSRGARAAMAALGLATGLLSATDAVAQDPSDLFHIARVRPVIAENAETRWFDGGPADGRVGQLVGEAVAEGAAKSMKGARPLTLEVRVRRFVPVKPGEARMFGPGHEIRADYVLIDETSGDVLNVSEQDLDLWARSGGGILGGGDAQSRISHHIEVMTEAWAYQLSCRRMKCPTGGAVAARPSSPEVVGVIYREESGATGGNPSPRAKPTVGGPQPRVAAMAAAPLGPRVVEQPIVLPSPLRIALRGAPPQAPARATPPFSAAPAKSEASAAEQRKPAIVLLAPEATGTAPAGGSGAVVVEPAATESAAEPVVTLTLDQDGSAAPARSEDFFETSFDDSAGSPTPPPVAAEPAPRPKPKVSAVFDLSGALAVDE